MPGKLKLAIAGLGLVGKRHVDAIHQSGVADLCGVVEPTHDGSVDIKGRTVPCYASVDTPDSEGTAGRHYPFNADPPAFGAGRGLY